MTSLFRLPVSTNSCHATRLFSVLRGGKALPSRCSHVQNHRSHHQTDRQANRVHRYANGKGTCGSKCSATLVATELPIERRCLSNACSAHIWPEGERKCSRSQPVPDIASLNLIQLACAATRRSDGMHPVQTPPPCSLKCGGNVVYALQRTGGDEGGWQEGLRGFRGETELDEVPSPPASHVVPSFLRAGSDLNEGDILN